VSKIRITEQLYASAVAQDWEEFEKCIHPDFVIRESAALPYAGNYRGVQGFRDLVRTVFTSFHSLYAEPGNYMEGDDHVAAIVTLHGKAKHTGREPVFWNFSVSRMAR
jgi:ketosteroid isomerase-like protein